MALEEERNDQEAATVYMEPLRKRSAFSRTLDDEIEQAVSSQSTSVERVEHEIDISCWYRSVSTEMVERDIVSYLKQVGKKILVHQVQLLNVSSVLLDT